MMEEKVLIKFRNIVKEFDGTIVLKGINLDIYENEFVTLLGPSGCGKTTLLRILGGFLEADEGAVIFDDEDIKELPPYKRELNTVFQKYALFPHMNVFDNIAFGLKIKKMDNDREKYYRSVTGMDWGDSRTYDLCLNTSLLGIQKSCDLIEEAVRIFLKERGIDPDANKDAAVK